MRNAIITGSTGLIGTAVVKFFISRGVNVLCLGRQPMDEYAVVRHFGAGLRYVDQDMADISALPSRLQGLPWAVDGKTVFLNFAWQGRKRLTDGTFTDQLNNAIHAAEAVKVAKILGCDCFINVGTLEETIIEKFLKDKGSVHYTLEQADYGLAKLASRDMCRMVAYLEKVDYVHTRLSVPLAADLSQGNYVASTLQKILLGEAYDEPHNEKPCDVILTDEIARAYYMIALKGINKADYFIGTSRLKTLKEIFLSVERLVQQLPDVPTSQVNQHWYALFDTAPLYNDTGFAAASYLEDEIKRKLQK